MGDILNPVSIGTMIGSAELIKMVFGPTCSYLGEGLKEFVQRRVENTGKITQKAYAKLNGRHDINENGVDPLMIKSVIDYGSFCEDELIQEYLSGLLVTSRVGLENDNRMYAYSKILESMSVYQVRSHYIIYNIMSKVYRGRSINLGIAENRALLQLYIPYSQFTPYVLLTNSEKLISASILDHAIYGLIRNALIETSIIKGSAEHISRTAIGSSLPEGGIVVQPSMLGIELYLAINSIGKDIQVNYFLRDDIRFDDLVDCSGIDISKCTVYP